MNPLSLSEPDAGLTLAKRLQVASAWLATAGSVMLLLSVGFSKAGQNIGGLLLILALVLAGPTVWRPLAREPLTWATIAWIVAVISSMIYAAIAIGIPVEEQSTHAWRFSRLFLIPLLAWGLYASNMSAYRAYVLLFCGFVFGTAYYTWQSGWPVFWATPGRVDISGEGVQFYGLFSACALLAALLFGQSIHRYIVSPYRRALHYSFWLVVALFSLHGFLLSQARGAMLGLAIVTITLFCYWGIRSVRLSRRTAPVLTGATAILAASLVATLLWSGALQHSTDRFARDADVLLQGPDPETGWYDETSMGIRLNQWIVALRGWQDHKLFGYGPDGARHVRVHADLPGRSARPAPHHLHNVYLDILVRFGLTGVVLWLMFFILCFRPSKSDTRSHFEPEARLYCLMAILLVAIAGITQTYWTSQVAWYLLAGLLAPSISTKLTLSPNNAG